ncbi:MAG: PKD domain-containing protein, partial [Bacteroidota bacterium]
LVTIPGIVPLTYNYNNINGIYLADSIGCIEISGTPSIGSSGIYNLLIDLTYYCHPVGTSTPITITILMNYYKIVVYPNSSCTFNSSINSTPVTCNVSNSGSASITSINGIAPFSYLWNNGATTQTINNLTSGIFYVTVTDNNSCLSINSVIVNGPSSPAISYFTVYPDSAIQHNWFAENFALGTPPLNYLWNWGDGTTSTGATPSHLYSATGYYPICLTVTDALGCIDTFCDSSTYIFKTEEDMSMISLQVILGQTNGIKAILSFEKKMNIYPNPCNTCEITGAVDATDLTVTDILGRKINASFSKSANGFYINLPEESNGIFFIRNIKTGEVVKFVRE